MNEINPIVIANNIEKLSAERGITKIKAFIDSEGVKDFIVNKNNKEKMPSFVKVFQMADYFGVSIDYLVGYTPENEENPRIQKLIEFASRLTDEQLDGFIETYSKLLDSLKKWFQTAFGLVYPSAIQEKYREVYRVFLF